MLKIALIQLLITARLFAQWLPLPTIEFVSDGHIIRAINLSDNGRTLAVMTNCKVSILILNDDNQTWNQNTVFAICPPDDFQFISQCLSPDGCNLVAGTSKGELRAWSLIGPNWCEAIFSDADKMPHKKDIACVQFSRDGLVFVSACMGGLCKIWNFDVLEFKYRHVNTIDPGKEGIAMVSLDARGMTLGIVHETGKADIWALKNNQWTLQQELNKDGEEYCSMSIFSSGQMIATGRQITFLLDLWEMTNDTWEKKNTFFNNQFQIEHIFIASDERNIVCLSQVGYENSIELDSFVLNDQDIWQNKGSCFNDFANGEEPKGISLVCLSGYGNVMALVRDTSIFTYTFLTSKTKSASNLCKRPRVLEILPEPKRQ